LLVSTLKGQFAKNILELVRWTQTVAAKKYLEITESEEFIFGGFRHRLKSEYLSVKYVMRMMKATMNSPDGNGTAKYKPMKIDLMTSVYLSERFHSYSLSHITHYVYYAYYMSRR
jgi:hypothetical protein